MMQADAEQNTCYNIWVHYMTLLFITIRIGNICFDDGSQQSLRVFTSRFRISLLKITMESNTKPET